ncbi:MAG: flavodoxin [Eubacterium sp.]|nr:flavodoxin [Eubacterium sp.]
MVFALLLTACGNSGQTGRGNNDTAGQGSLAAEQKDPAAWEKEAEGAVPKEGKVLVAYFAVAENSDVDAVSSASVSDVNGQTKGRMAALAEMIQEKTKGELFSIKTSVKYPGDIGKLIDYAQEEQDKDARPELTSHIENLDGYSVIFVGFPTWWYDLPQVLYSFFDEYDFSGKTIIPFNSHNGSQFSGTIETIQKLEPDAAVITDGFTVNERDVPGAKSDIDEWLSGLGY